MRRQFSCNEWQTIQDRSSEEEKLEMFMRYWVMMCCHMCNIEIC